MELLSGKVAVVTGGTRGIGRAITIAFAANGASVYFSGRDERAARETIEAVSKAGGRAEFARADVAKSDEVKSLIDGVVSEAGKIDILVNNAGINRDALLVRLKEEDWDAVLNVNLKGAFLCSQAAAKHMIKERSGSIINISSVIGIAGNAGQANYSASKAGLIGLTKTMAKELAVRGIRVNAVAPGFIETDMTAALPESARSKILPAIPLGRFGDAKEVAGAALFLASEMSSYITGQVIVVDGGLFI